MNKLLRLISNEIWLLWFPKSGVHQTSTCLGWLSPSSGPQHEKTISWHFSLCHCLRITSCSAEHASSSAVGLEPRTLFILQEPAIDSTRCGELQDTTSKLGNCNCRGCQHCEIAITSFEIFMEWHAQARRDIGRRQEEHRLLQQGEK